MIGIGTGIPFGSRKKPPFYDGNSWGIYDFRQCLKDSYNYVFQINDLTDNNNHFLQLVTNRQGLFTAEGILIDGVDDFYKTLPSTLNQPILIYLVGTEIAWKDLATLIDGNESGSGRLYQRISEGKIRQASASIPLDNNNSVIGKVQIYTTLFSGQNSFNQIDNNRVTGITGNLPMNGLSLGNSPTSPVYANFLFKAAIVRKTIDSDSIIRLTLSYLSNKYNIVI